MLKNIRLISIIVLASCNLGLSSCVNTDAETIYSRIFHSGLLTQGPEKKAEELFRLIEKGDVSKAKNIYKFSFSSSYKDAELMLTEKYNQMKKKKGIESFRASRACSSGERVEIDYELKYNDGSIEEDSIDLLRLDGKWRVLDNPGIPCF